MDGILFGREKGVPVYDKVFYAVPCPDGTFQSKGATIQGESIPQPPDGNFRAPESVSCVCLRCNVFTGGNLGEGHD